ncbi:hypothetical protein [Roseibium alexandrii]|uniref:hypothetical protein n=1 Tax=Roseibium alexandrii TaxID=388408 RepID=UPI003753AB7D
MNILQRETTSAELLIQAMIKKRLLSNCISGELERSKDPLAAERPIVYERVQNKVDGFKFGAMHNNTARRCFTFPIVVNLGDLVFGMVNPADLQRRSFGR